MRRGTSQQYSNPNKRVKRSQRNQQPTLREQLAERASRTTWEEFDTSLTPAEYRELSFFMGDARQFWQARQNNQHFMEILETIQKIRNRGVSQC